MAIYECLYCGSKFSPSSWVKEEYIRCPDCQDTNLKKIRYEKGDVFGYYYTEGNGNDDDFTD